jgi:hypothetical protein
MAQYNGNSGSGGAPSPPPVPLEVAHANGVRALQRREAFSAEHPEIGIRMKWDSDNRCKVCEVREPDMKPVIWTDFDAMMDDLETRYES